MNTNNKSQNPAHRRHQHFIDATIQGRLLAALIVLELVLFSGAMIWLYLDLSAIIDAHLYRVHYADNTDGLSPFLATLFTVIPVILLANLVALWLADVIWRGYVRRIVNQLRRILARISKLDLREEPEDRRVHHDVIVKARSWLANERQAFQKVKKVVSTLPETIDFSDEKELIRTRSALRELKTFLR
ncbi:hypothetical protein MNBD_GAMMA24-1630 [hydrothermal vent metagenome]|uniref:Uncharacterized protein n=1 Tax=hydrothermal vent metagenome TaxID=652676 RepID=A0A3B1BP51_9ZZZZ